MVAGLEVFRFSGCAIPVICGFSIFPHSEQYRQNGQPDLVDERDDVKLVEHFAA